MAAPQVPEQPGRLVQDELVQLMDQPGFFQDGHEDPGGNHSPLRIDPPGQGFHAAEFARKAADHRLVIHLDMTGLEAWAKCSITKERISSRAPSSGV